MSQVTNKVLAGVVLQKLKAGQAPAKVMHALAAYLVSERRSKDAGAILRQVEQQQALAGQLEVQVTTAHALTGELRQHIEKLFAKPNQKVIINEKLDSAVIGGVLVESAEQRLDSTVRRQLQRLKGMGV